MYCLFSNLSDIQTGNKLHVISRGATKARFLVFAIGGHILVRFDSFLQVERAVSIYLCDFPKRGNGSFTLLDKVIQSLISKFLHRFPAGRQTPVFFIIMSFIKTFTLILQKHLQCLCRNPRISNKNISKNISFSNSHLPLSPLYF